jgi:RNA polymerase subunit RPABC4/transcription elongation factor Spt4
MGERRQCPECRFDLKADDSACPFCGVVLKKVPPPSAASRGWGRRPALKACPDCGGSVSARAESCPHCGCPPKGKRRSTRPTGGALVISLIKAFAFIVIFIMVVAHRRGAKAPPNPPLVAPGDRAVLACKGGDGAYVAFGIEAWSRMAHAQSRRDTAEMHRLVDDGRIALVADRTPVQVVGSGTMMLQVRVLAGPHEGREVWVRKEFVRPAPR